MTDRRGAQGSPVLQIWCNSNYYFRSYGILKKNGTGYFSLIGRHLESVGRIFCIELTSQVAIFVPGKGARCQRAKSRTELFPDKSWSRDLKFGSSNFNGDGLN